MPSGYILRNMLMYAKLVWTEVLKPTQRHSDRIKGINISTKSRIISGVLFIATSLGTNCNLSLLLVSSSLDVHRYLNKNAKSEIV